jgi:hypothetical protein
MLPYFDLKRKIGNKNEKKAIPVFSYYSDYLHRILKKI